MQYSQMIDVGRRERALSLIEQCHWVRLVDGTISDGTLRRAIVRYNGLLGIREIVNEETFEVIATRKGAGPALRAAERFVKGEKV